MTNPDKIAVELASRAADLALCLDFDGTLAPIVDDPDQARPLPGLVDLLDALAGRYAAVALVSGRPATYLAEARSRTLWGSRSRPRPLPATIEDLAAGDDRQPWRSVSST